MAFDRYWPALNPGGRNYAQGRSLRLRRLVLLAPLSGPLAVATYTAIRPSTRSTGLIVLAVVAVLFLAVIVAAIRSPAPPSGIYEVDDAGEPLEYLGPRPPLELRRNRGMTYDAFVATVKARRPRS